MDSVKVNLYKPLDKPLALAVAFQHNDLLEKKKKAMSFFDKVKVMRDCRPASMRTPSQRKQWKDILCIIFRAETRKRLRSRLHVHLHVAEFEERLFQKCIAINERYTITERRMKNLIKLDEDSIHECVDEWMKFGTGHFSTKVSEMSKKKTYITDNESNCSQDIHTERDILVNPETVDQQSYEDLLKRIEKLKEENSEFLRQEVKENKKRKFDEGVLIEPGDSVKAMWTDGQFYAACVEKLETYYHVIFDDDKIKKNIEEGIFDCVNFS